MRLLIVGMAAALLSVPVVPVSAARDAPSVRMAQATDFSAAKKKAKVRKAKKEQYMRAVPSK